jgi:hypothetical protein
MQEIKIDQFFTPCPETTDQIIRRIGEKRSAYFHSLGTPADGSDGDAHTEPASDELLTSIFTALAEDSQKEAEDEVRKNQRWLKGIIYHFLGRLAHRLGTESHRDYNVRECIVKGMSSRLGLKDASDSELLEHLASEFGKWLNEREGKNFVAGWGTIVGSVYDSNSFRLQKLRKSARDSAISELELSNLSETTKPSLMRKYEDANLILKLYELRREPIMREARNWFFSFNPQSASDYLETMMGEHSGHARMVISYWDMAASLVNNGAIDEHMFNDANGEHLFVFAKIEPILEDLRQITNQPDFLRHFEALVRRAPNSAERLAAIRERIKLIQVLMAERAGAAFATA